jgi:RNA polymerase-binding transcription factor DksA
MQRKPQRDVARQPGSPKRGSEESQLPLSEARELLHERRERVVNLRAAHQQQRGDILDDLPLDTGDAAVREDWVDRHDQFEARELRELQAIDAALARIESGEYGICKKCEEPIEGDRLRALPETPLCVVCAQPSPTSPEYARVVQPAGTKM